jgi:DNA ligase-1
MLIDMKPWEILQHLESDNSRLFKESVISEHLSNREFVWGLRVALDSMITFGVADIPVKKDPTGVGLDLEEFEQLARDLENRVLTGNAARDAILVAMAKATQEQWNDWYRRILIKDLRCGISEKTVNKMAKVAGHSPIVPVFGCMLANNGDNHPKKIKGECIVEYKYDGIRALAIVKNGSVTIYSRNGKVLYNFPHIEKALNKPEFDGIVFDGEIMSEDFQSLMKQVNRKENAQTQDAYLALFDVIPLDEFEEGQSSATQIERKTHLEEYRDIDPAIKVVDYWEVDFDSEEGREQFANLNKIAIEKGYEGVMIKPIDGIYECKRTYAWLKMKPYIEVTLTVVELEEGTGKNEGLLGALVCEGHDEGKDIRVKVGSGLTDDDRTDIWSNQDAVIGQLVEIRADSFSLADGEEVYSLRFPRFKTFRGFNPGEKL